MEQRPLRLGDPVDDYCPRERRLTNHAIVAIVGDEIRQTRCTTCDAEHVYKGGKAPARKKKDTTAQLYDQVLANVTAGAVVKPAPAAVAEPPVEARVAASVDLDTVDATVATDTQPTPPPAPPVDEGWTLHRTLIRATLPRTDVQTPRPIPEFTMHQRNVRGSHVFRGGGMFDHGNGNGNGNGFDRASGNDRSHGHRHHPRGDGQQPGAPNGQRPGGGRRRRRHKKPRPTN